MFDECRFRMHSARRHSKRAGAFRRTDRGIAMVRSDAASRDYLVRSCHPGEDEEYGRTPLFVSEIFRQRCGDITSCMSIDS